MSDIQSVHPEQNILAAFALGKLPPFDVATVEAHLADCPECCETLQNLGGDTFVDLVRRASALEFGSSAGAIDPATATAAYTHDPTDLVLEVPPELVGHPRYDIFHVLGHGGMGVVFVARHRLMNRLVALKVINPTLIQRPEAVARFRREVEAAAKLAHPNIVTAYDAEQAGDLHFLVMEYIEGTSLSQVVDSGGPLPAGTACEYVRQMALALEHAHQAGMVHRDIKPHNVILDRTGQVKILDFGIASLVESPSVSAPDKTLSGNLQGTEVMLCTPIGDASRSSAGRLTEQGTLMGTPDYVAPEQVANASSADIRADIYSLGCTLYYLLAGRPPFPEGTAQEKLRAHAQQMPTPLSALNADLPSELGNVIDRMMAKAPDDRYPTPAAVAAALEPFAQTPTPQPSALDSRVRRGILAFVAVAVLLCFSAAGVIYIKTDKGMLQIETTEKDVQLVLSRDGQQVKVIDAHSGSSVEQLSSGKYNIDLRGADDLELSVWSKSKSSGELRGPLDHVQDGFTLSRGETVLARVERTTKEPAAPSTESQPPSQASETPTDDPSIARPGDKTSRIRLDVQPTNTVPIAIHNWSFEEPRLSDGESKTEVPRWTIDSQSPNAAGVQNLLNSDFAGATDSGGRTTIPNGRNVAFCTSFIAGDSATLSQILAPRLEPETHYVLHVVVGRRASGDWPGYRVSLRAGGKVLAEDDNSLTLEPGQLATSTVHYATGSENAQFGQPLEISLSAIGVNNPTEAQVQFDRVQLYTWPVGMKIGPPSITLFWMPLAGSKAYAIERSLAKRSGPFEQIAQLPGDATTYVDNSSALKPNTTYYYRVMFRGNESVRSTPMGVTTLPLVAVEKE